MSKLFSFIILSVLLAAPVLHANVKVHFEGDISQIMLDALPKWIEPVSMKRAEWLIRIEEGESKRGFSAFGNIFDPYSYSDDETEGSVYMCMSLPLYLSICLAMLPVTLPLDAIFCSRTFYSLDLYNLNTGWKDYRKVACRLGKDYVPTHELLERSREKLAGEIANFLEDYYKDRKPPQLALSPPFDLRESTTPEEKVIMRFTLTDDVELGRVVIQKDGRAYREYSAADRKRFTKSLETPLELGYNKFRILAYDWMNKATMTEEITIFRSKGGGEPPRRPEPPELSVKVSSTDQTNTLMGGTFGGVVVTIHNSGKGYADNIKVSLSGDSQLCEALGNTKEIEEIAPGDSAVVQFRRTLPADLTQKQTRLKVSVTADNYTIPSEDALTLTLFPKPEDVDSDIPSSGIRRDGYALIVGISQYQHTKGPQFALNDAEVFSLYAEKVLGIPSRNIKLLTDEGATTGPLTGQIKDWLAQKSGFKLIYFAGHGVPDPENPRSGEPFLLPYDGDPELKSTLIRVADLARLAGTSNDTILVILDACFSGGGGGRTPELAQRAVVMMLPPPEEHGLYLAAADSTQAAKDYIEAKHGYFTYYLLLGLKGKADKNSDGWITTEELYNYVREQVHEITDGRQTPVLKGQGSHIKVGRSR